MPGRKGKKFVETKEGADKVIGYWNDKKEVEYHEGDIYVGGKPVTKEEAAAAVYRLGISGEDPNLLHWLLKALESQSKDEAEYNEACRPNPAPDHEELIGFLYEPLRVLCGNMKGEARLNEADICMLVGLMNNWFEARARSGWNKAEGLKSEGCCCQ